MFAIDNYDFKGKRAIIRVDFNVPLNEKGEVTDDTRIRAAIPTIKKVLEKGGSVILMSHLGRPKKNPDPKFSLEQIVPAIEKRLGVKVMFAGDCMGEKAAEMAANLKPGEVMLLENLRFYAEEEGKPRGLAEDATDEEKKAAKKALKEGPQKEFVKRLASYADCYINDAFGTAHRAHASTALIADYFPNDKMFGYVMENELKAIDGIMLNPQRPFCAILGGSKVSTKITIIENLLEKVDVLILGGGMTYTFAAAEGGKVGNSICEPDQFQTALDILAKAKQKGVKVVMSPDALIADAFSADANTDVAPANNIPDGWEGVDIAEEGKKVFREEILKCKTILWNGPVGVFEIDKFATGSRAVAEAIAEATSKAAIRWRASTSSAWRTRFRMFRPAAAPCSNTWKARCFRVWRRSANKPTFRSRSEIKTRGVPAWSDTPVVTKYPNTMKKIILFAATIACMASCQNTSKTPAIDLANFDLSVAPNADFYEYATGGWQKNNPLKPEYSRYGSFDILRDNNEKRINELFSEMTKMKAEPGSIEQKISDLYKMGLDSVRLNAEGAAPVKDAVGEILAIGDRAQLTGAIAGLHTAIANPFFSVGVQADLMNSDINALYISQSGLTMGDRDYYLDPENENIRTAYKEYLGKLFRLTGIPEADIEKAVAGVMNIETKLAEKSWSNTELRDIPAQYNPTAKAEFEKTYDAIDWPAYYKAMGIGDFDTIIVTTKSSIANANDLMKNAPLEDIRYYLAAQYLDDAASYLSDDFQQASFDFYGKAMAGQQEMKPRWKRAMSVPNGILSEAVGEMYVAKYFPAKDKERMLGLVKNLQTALGQHIAALDWMSDATKAKAQEKLAAFTVKIGYPDKWKDYSTLAIDPSKSYFENIVNASLWYTADNISKLGKPVDKDEWHMSPQTVNAYYNPTTNEICFPAAILQPPFYNPEADDAVNYGAIGVVIGHEMTHGFDDQGRNFDKDGNMNNWWTDEDAAAFKAKTDILVKQFDAIEVLPAKEGQPAIFANGALSLGENIADQGGLRVARTAYRNSLAGTEPAPIDGFTADQRFYLAYATLWAQNIRDEEIARLTKLDVHSLGKWRVNATLRNLQDFYDAFSMTDGEMFMPEEERVVIW